MGFRTIVSPADLSRGDLVEPGWYPVQITDYEEKEAPDKSVNGIFTLTLLEDTKGVKAGFKFQRLFNEKALGFGKNLYATLNLPKNEDGGYALDSDLFKKIGASGTKLKIYVQHRKDDRPGKNATYNDVADFAPLA